MTAAHKSALAMVRSLATYMTEPRRIQSAVYAEFGTIPPTRQVQDEIARFHRPPTPDHPREGSGMGDERRLNRALRHGSDALRKAIIVKHRRIMRTLEAQGNYVRWE